MKREEIKILSFLKNNNFKLLSKSQQNNTITSLSIDKNIPSQQKCKLKNNIYEKLRSKILKMELQLCQIQKLVKNASKTKKIVNLFLNKYNITNNFFFLPKLFRTF